MTTLLKLMLVLFLPSIQNFNFIALSNSADLLMNSTGYDSYKCTKSALLRSDYKDGIYNTRNHIELICNNFLSYGTRSVDTLTFDTIPLQNISSISAMTIARGRVELNWYNAYSHDQKIYNFFDIQPTLTGDRQDVFNSLLQIVCGVSRRRNLNIGLDINSTIAHYRPEFFSSQQYSLTRLGPKVRWRPFGQLQGDMDFVVQNTATFTVLDKDDLLANGIEFGNQFYFFKYLPAKKVILQFSSGITWRPKSSNGGFDKKAPIIIPFTLFAGYYPRRDITLFSYLNYTNEFGTMPSKFNEKYYTRRNALNLAIGAQMLFGYRFGVYVIPQVAIFSKNGGGANQIGVGLRYLI